MIPFRTAVVTALLAAAGLLTAGTASADPRLPGGPEGHPPGDRQPGRVPGPDGGQHRVRPARRGQGLRRP